MSETEIAKRLGVAQAAVSKYLNHNYSKNVGKLVREIESRNLHGTVVSAVLKERSYEYIADSIDRAAAEKGIVRLALSLG